MVENETLSEQAVRLAVLVRRAAGVEQQLQSQRQANVADINGAHNDLYAASAVADDYQP